MTADESARIIARLKVHFPTFLPKETGLAAAAAADWMRALADCPADIGERVADRIVGSWHARDGAPRIGDWRDLAGPLIAARIGSMVGPALESGVEPMSVKDARRRHVRDIKAKMGWTA